MHESSAPDREQSTRTEVYPTGSGEPDRGQGVRWGAVHPMGSSTPGQNGCNAYRSGVAPSPTSTTEAHCRLPLDVCRSAGHEAPSRLVGQSAVRAGAMARGVSAWIAVLRVRCRVGYRRGSRCVRVRWLPRRAHPRAGWIAVRVGRRRAWAINVDRGACGDEGRPTAHPRAGRIAVRAGGDASVGHRRGSWRSLCVSRRPRPCRCRDGCRETRAPGEPGRWPLRR